LFSLLILLSTEAILLRFFICNLASFIHLAVFSFGLFIILKKEIIIDEIFSEITLFFIQSF